MYLLFLKAPGIPNFLVSRDLPDFCYSSRFSSKGQCLLQSIQKSFIIISIHPSVFAGICRMIHAPRRADYRERYSYAYKRRISAEDSGGRPHSGRRHRLQSPRRRNAQGLLHRAVGAGKSGTPGGAPTRLRRRRQSDHLRAHLPGAAHRPENRGHGRPDGEAQRSAGGAVPLRRPRVFSAT